MKPYGWTYICPWCPLLLCPKRTQIGDRVTEGSLAALREPRPSLPSTSALLTLSGEGGGGRGRIASPLVLPFTREDLQDKGFLQRRCQGAKGNARDQRKAEGGLSPLLSVFHGGWGWEVVYRF